MGEDFFCFWGGLGCPIPQKNHHRTSRYIPLREESDRFSGYLDLKGRTDRQTDRQTDGQTDRHTSFYFVL